MGTRTSSSPRNESFFSDQVVMNHQKVSSEHFMLFTDKTFSKGDSVQVRTLTKPANDTFIDKLETRLDGITKQIGDLEKRKNKERRCGIDKKYHKSDCGKCKRLNLYTERAIVNLTVK